MTCASVRPNPSNIVRLQFMLVADTHQLHPCPGLLKSSGSKDVAGSCALQLWVAFCRPGWSFHAPCWACSGQKFGIEPESLSLVISTGTP